MYDSILNFDLNCSFVAVPPMVQDAKHVAVNPADHNAVSRWRESNKAVSSLKPGSN